MRDILFKGFHENVCGKTVVTLPNGKSYKGFWVYGYYWTNHVGNYFIRVTKDDCEKYVVEDYEVLAETVCQYTEECDKNGNMLFENDIVLIPRYRGGKHKTTIYFKNGKFAVDGSNYGFKDLASKKYEKIGNIFGGDINDR